MPKLKVRGGVKKRLKVTGSGRIKRKKCNSRHILTKKNAKRKRHLRQDDMIHPSDEKAMKKLLNM
jgi:large subunit ribosomal protein L35